MPPKIQLKATFLKACQLHWLVLIEGYTQNHAGQIVGVCPGTVCHIIHGRRFPGAFPIPLFARE